MAAKRIPVIAGNWKMNKTLVEAVNLSQELSDKYDDKKFKEVEIVICPPFVNLHSVKNVLETDKSVINLGAQDCHWEASGAYTGCISCDMLKSVGATHCIIGHSERREYFKESDEDVNKKVKALLAAGITPIMCCGESLEIRDAGKTLDFVKPQIVKGLEGLNADELKKVIVAYEPIWAIVTGRTATPKQAQEVCAAIRVTLKEIAGEDVANEMRVLYGGSMNPSNVDDLMAQVDIDGGLIGGASLKCADFSALIDSAARS